MRFILVAVYFSIVFTGCVENDRIAEPGDYEVFLNGMPGDSAANDLVAEVGFWESRLRKDTGNYVYMVQLAVCLRALFDLTGDAKHLVIADSLLWRSSARLNHHDADILFALSQSRISQHRFRDAQSCLAAAEKAGADQYTLRLLQYDAEIELGAEMSAVMKLQTLKNQNSFDCLVRLARLEDQKGNLAKAINFMELALAQVKESNQKLYCWTLANLADMYGHAGRVAEAYRAYLSVLRRDKNYLHALEGIAWIAFSYDGNAGEAARIYNYILSQKKAPQVLIKLAEIAEWHENPAKKEEYLRRFLQEANEPACGNMYNKYLLEIYNDYTQNSAPAIDIAMREVAERPTPQTYEWLAWSYFKNSDTARACDIINNFVYKRNFEPTALWHMATIFAAAGKDKRAEELLNECLESRFELGPVKMRMILKEQSIVAR